MTVQTCRPAASLIDSRRLRTDPGLIEAVAHHGPVIVIDRVERRPHWEQLGASAVITVDALADELPAALAAGLAAGPRRAPARGSRAAAHAARSGRLVAVLGGSGAEAATGADALVHALARARAPTPARDRVVLAELTRHRLLTAVHGLDQEVDGLPELLIASRYGTPPAHVIDQVLHRSSTGRHRILPGLRHPHGWVTLGSRSMDTALQALRAHADLVVAAVESDLEGEHETGSFDVEDRNLLARATVAAADLVVTVAGPDPVGRADAVHRLRSLAAFGVGPERIVVLVDTRGRLRPRRAVAATASHLGAETETAPAVIALGGITGRPRRTRIRRGASRRLATAIGALAEGAAGPVSDEPVTDEPVTDEPVADEPERIVPGTLGHWSHGIDGWITPSTPQQP